MMKQKEQECLHCHRMFVPNRFNQHSQKYCFREECRHASSKASRRKYRNKPENKTPAKLKSESERVRKWQESNPGYWKGKKKAKKNNKEPVLRDIAQAGNDVVLRDIALLKTSLHKISQLIDTVQYYRCVTVGLTSTLTGSVLRDIIGSQLDSYYDRGSQLLAENVKSQYVNIINERKEADEEQNFNQSTEKAPDSQTFQLGGSSSGA
ncbi:MAG: hypothetical protein U9Q21_03535 [Candidatus Auribacterota bacterium]|nr:hypothetical protein [Candidatus Auribacterota bacterium]